MTERLLAAATTLRAAGIDSPRREAGWLLEHADGDAEAFRALVARRAAREPLAFLIGCQEFWTLTLEVSPVTLIPRLDSETLIVAALAHRPERERIRTYNFPQGRVSDHRINMTLYKIDRVMAGELDEFIDALTAEDQAARLAAEG